MIGKPPACPEFSQQAWRELRAVVMSGEYPELVEHVKRQDRMCEAITVMRGE
jgi:hypothetical protein